MELVVNNGNTVVYNENNWPDTITKCEITKGTLSIINNSDEIKVLSFDNGLEIKVYSYGYLNVAGKLVQVATGNGQTNQSFDLPVSGFSIPALWIETEKDSGIFEKWICINNGGLDFKFSDIANSDLTGKVFRIEDGKIKFSDSEDYCKVPADGVKIMMPNIIISAADGDNTNQYAYFTPGLGGNYSFRNVSFSKFRASVEDASRYNMQTVGIIKPLTIKFGHNVKLEDVAISNDSQYASGLMVYYSDGVTFKNVIAQSQKSYGVIAQYCNNLALVKTKGILLKRDSNLDSAIYLGTVNIATLNDVKCVGGQLGLDNCYDVEGKTLELADTVNMKNTSLNGEPNININDSKKIKLTDITIPKGGAGYLAPVNVINSSEIYVIGVNSEDNFFDYMLSVDAVFDSKFANFNIASVQRDETVKVDKKSSNITIQKFVTDDVRAYTIGAKSTLIKGVYSNDVEFVSGAYNTIMAQMYTGATTGKIVFNMIKNEHSTILSGNPMFSYTQGLTLSKGDVVEISSPYMLRGITFNKSFNVVGMVDKLRVFVKIKTTHTETDYLILNEDNLNEINKLIDGTSFKLTLRFDANYIDDNTIVNISKVEFGTLDSRVNYPVFYKDIYIEVNDILANDHTAVYALMYKTTYEKGVGVPVTDAEGMPIIGKIDGRKILHFEYDFDFDDTAGRVPGKDFEVVLVVASALFSEPMEIFGSIKKDVPANFIVNSRPDKAYEVALEVLKSQTQG